jgi:hypothetical protein
MRTSQALYFLFILVYTRGIIQRLTQSVFWTNFLIEVSIVLVACSILNRSPLKLAPGWIFVALFVTCTILSGIASGDDPYFSFLYFRMLVYGYIIFWTVWNANLTGHEILRLSRLILSLWILQIAAAIFELFVLNQRIEAHVGTIAFTGGGAATAFPLFAMAYVMAFYCYYKRSVWLILLAFSFGIVGYASGKRAIYFLIPAFYTAIILFYYLRERSFLGLQRMLGPIFICFLIFPLFIFGLTQSKRFSTLKGKETVTVISGAAKISEEYTFRVYRGGKTFGRTATSLKLLRQLCNGMLGQYLFGFGPASLMEHGGKRAKRLFGAEYGIVGWAKDTISVGWPAMIFHISFYAFLWWRLYRQRLIMSNDYAKALYFGTHFAFAAFFLLYFFYLDAFVVAGWFTFVHFSFLALLLSPKHHSALLFSTKTTPVLPKSGSNRLGAISG